MSKNRTHRIETPGETTAPEIENTEGGDSAATAADEPQAAPTPPTPATAPNPEPVTDGEKKRELDRQVAAVAADLKNGSKGALDWGHLTSPHQLANKVNTYVDPDKDLPHPDDVDWSKVKGDRILTKQGWLLKA